MRKLVQNKAKTWDEDREVSFEFINEIGEYFDGNRQWDKKEGYVDESYADWFKGVAEQISNLDFKKTNKTGVKIPNIVKVLEAI